MKKLIIIIAIIAAATVAGAAQQYYNYPDAQTLPDNGRMLIYDNGTSKNITGSKLKQQVNSNPTFRNISSAASPTTCMYFDGPAMVIGKCP